MQELFNNRRSKQLVTVEVKSRLVEVQEMEDNEVTSGAAKETDANMPSSETKDIIWMWSKVQVLVEKNYFFSFFSPNIIPVAQPKK